MVSSMNANPNVGRDALALTVSKALAGASLLPRDDIALQREQAYRSKLLADHRLLNLRRSRR